MDFYTVYNHGHIDLYINGKFYCSVDKLSEAIEEYNNYVKERVDGNGNNNSAQKLQRAGTV